jgi:predicted ArsR family transcriptional regulator
MLQQGDDAQAEPGPRGWTFLTNHAHVLLVVRRDPHVRLRDIAAAVGVTERAVQLILGDLEQAGYLRRSRVAGATSTTCSAGRCATRSSAGRPSTTCSTPSAQPLRSRTT